jgi:hypothetical protein
MGLTSNALEAATGEGGTSVRQYNVVISWGAFF